MDNESLNRGEAVAGLGLLGALMLGLVGVIVFRIVGAKPVTPRPLGGPIVAAEPALPENVVSPEPKSASPIPIAADQTAEPVPLTSGAEPAPPASAPAEPAVQAMPRVAPPHFVAPANWTPQQ